MAAALSLIVFWTMVFIGLSTRDGAVTKQERIEKRFAKLLRDKVETNPDVLIEIKEAPSVKRLRQQLHVLGLNRKTDLQKALLFRRICYLVPFILSGALFFMGFPMPQVLTSMAIFSVIFILIPKIWIMKALIDRRKEIEKNLPDTLDLITLCLEAGLSFDSTLVRVAEEQRHCSSHLSRELLLTNQEILAGVSRKQALANLADRTGIDEMKTLVGAIQQSMKLGTSLVKTLRTQAMATRKKKREQIRAAIMKTPVKLIFPLIFFIFPTLMIVILAPSLVNTFRHLSAVAPPTGAVVTAAPH